MENRKLRKRSFMAMMVLLGLMLAGCLFVFHTYLFGNEVMVYGGAGSDTKQQYIMWYNGVANRLRSGDLAAWDFHNGLGISQLENNLTAPFNILIYLIGMFFGPARIAGAMVYIQILKVLLSGLFCYLFLSEFRLREDAKLIASFLYAFNGYLMIWGQHYMMGSAVVFLPLLLWTIERTILRARDRLPDPYDIDEEKDRKERGRFITTAAFGVSLATALIVLSGYYMGYMVMLGFGIYVTVRVLVYENARMRDRWKLFGTIAVFMLLGVAIGSIGIFPQVKALAASSRLDANASFFAKIKANLSLWDKEYYRSVIYRFFGNNLQGVGKYFVGYGNYYEAANLFFSALFVILFLQYLFLIPRQKRKGLQKLAQYLGVLIGLFILCVQVGSLIFNGFAYAFSRETFLFMPFFALICAWTLDDIIRKRRISYIALVLSLLVCCAVYAKAYLNYTNGDYETNALILLVGALIMIWALFQLGRKTPPVSVMVRVLIAAVFITVIADASLGYRNRDTVKKTDDGYFKETYAGNTGAALKWIEENDGEEFYRIEKDYSNAAYYMESLAQDYRSVSTYNSTLNSNIFKFITTLWPQLLTGYDINHFTYRNTIHDTTMGDLVGVRYLLTHTDDLKLDGYEMVHQEGDVFVYRNNNVNNIAHFYEHTMTEGEYRKLDGSLDVWNLLPQVLITDGENASDLTAMEEESFLEAEAKNILDTGKLGLKNYHMLDDGASIDGAGIVTIPLKKAEMEKWTYVTAEFDVETDGATGLYIYTNDRRGYEYFNNGKIHYRINVPVDTEAISIEVDGGNNKMTVSGLQFYGSTSKRTFSDAAEIVINAPKKDSIVTGHVNASTDGMLMLAIPMQEGWNVYVDGEKQETVRSDFGFIAFPVTKGSHEILARFTPPWLKLSAIITAAAIVIWILGFIFTLIRGAVKFVRKKKEEKAEQKDGDAVQEGEGSEEPVSETDETEPGENVSGTDGTVSGWETEAEEAETEEVVPETDETGNSSWEPEAAGTEIGADNPQTDETVSSPEAETVRAETAEEISKPGNNGWDPETFDTHSGEGPWNQEWKPEPDEAENGEETEADERYNPFEIQ